MNSETKAGRIALAAHRYVVRGLDPADAWRRTLEDEYEKDKLDSQLRHTCPKWAFVALCESGAVASVEGSTQTDPRRRRSGEFVLEALDFLRSDPSYAWRKRDLKDRVFGERGSENYRTPNDEVEVLLALWQGGLIVEPPFEKGA